MEAFALSPDAPRVPLPQRLLSDERLLRLIAAGNSQAFGAIYSRYHAPLYAYCRSIVRDPDDARDALQNTMLKALAALNRGQDRELSLKPWLFRIAHNESISLLRRRRPSEPLTDAVTPPVAGADREVVARERLGQLVSDLQALPERQRGALIMREVNGLSYDEIAGALTISPGAARQTVFEARTALSEYGEGREVACENIRRSISDGDGRALRARRVRAHLRACNGCRDFQSTLTVRRRDLALLAPGLSAGTVVALFQGVIGAGIAGSAAGGAGVLGGSAGGLLASGAAKSVVAVVAAAAAGAGAVEIEHRVSESNAAKPVATHTAGAGVVASAASATPGPAAREATAMIRTASAEPTLALVPVDTVAKDKKAGNGPGRNDRGRGNDNFVPGLGAGAGGDGPGLRGHGAWNRDDTDLAGGGDRPPRGEDRPAGDGRRHDGRRRGDRPPEDERRAEEDVSFAHEEVDEPISAEPVPDDGRRHRPIRPARSEPVAPAPPPPLTEQDAPEPSDDPVVAEPAPVLVAE